MSHFGTTELKRASIEKRALALADQFIHDGTLALTNAMDLYTLTSLVRNLDDVGKELSTLSLYRVDLDMNFTSEILPILGRFKEVIVDDCEGSDLHAVVSGVFLHENIQRFHYFSQISDPQVDSSFENVLRNSKLYDLTLTVEMPPETAHLLSLGINQSQLKCLSLDQSEIYPESIRVLCDCFQMNRCLEILKLEHCRLRDNELADLIRSIIYHPALLELSLRMNYLDSEGMEAIVHLLQSTPRLKQLDLAQQNPGYLDLRHLAEALRVNETLTHLNLQENFLSDAAIPIFTDALAVNRTLRDVNMENCELRDQSLGHILNFLQHTPRLTHLRLKDNNFRERVDENILIEVAQHNYNLQELDIDSDSPLPMQVRFHFFLNKAGRRYLAHECIHPGMWATLIERVHKLLPSDENIGFHEHDVIYALLHGPALLQR